MTKMSACAQIVARPGRRSFVSVYEVHFFLQVFGNDIVDQTNMVVWFGSKGFYVSREWWEDITVCRSARRFGGHFDPMATNTKQYGPNGVRKQRIQLAQIDTESECTGWRKPNKERQDTPSSPQSMCENH